MLNLSAKAVAICFCFFGQVATLSNSSPARVEFENDRVRVLRVRYEAGLSLVAHNHLGTLVVALTRIQLRVTESAARRLRLDPGAVRWINAGHYAISNPANQPAELIEIELKQAQSPAREVLPHLVSTSKEPMPASLEPHHRLKYQNQYIRVLEVTLEPGESSLFHTHQLDVLYVALAQAVARQQRDGEDWGPEAAFAPGAVSFDHASTRSFTHHLKNVGTTQFHTINIEFLR